MSPCCALRKIPPRAIAVCWWGGCSSITGFEWNTSAATAGLKQKRKLPRKLIRIGTNYPFLGKPRRSRGSLFHRFHEKNGRTILRHIRESRDSAPARRAPEERVSTGRFHQARRP